MLQKQLLKNNVKANVFEFEQHSPSSCPEQTLLQWGPSALLHTLQCYRTRDTIQLPTLFVAAHKNVYGFVLFSCFGKMPFKKCNLPLPLPFTQIIWEVWMKCPSRSWTVITSNQAAHGEALPGVRAQLQRVPLLPLLVSRPRDKQLHLLFLSHLFKVILLSFFRLRLLIPVLLPHIWLWAWTHFLDLIPGSCLLPVLSHRG